MGLDVVSGQQIEVQEARFLCGRRILKFTLRSGCLQGASCRSSSYFNILRFTYLGVVVGVGCMTDLGCRAVGWNVGGTCGYIQVGGIALPFTGRMVTM